MWYRNLPVYGAWPLTDPCVEVETAVPEVLCSSRSWRRSREVVAVLESLDDRLHCGRTLKPLFLRCSKEMLKLEWRWAYALSSCGGIIFRWLTFRAWVNTVYDGWHRSRPGIVWPVTCPLALACTWSTIGIYDPVFHNKNIIVTPMFSYGTYARIDHSILNRETQIISIDLLTNTFAESARLVHPWHLRGRTAQLTCGTVQLFFDFLLIPYESISVENTYRFFYGDRFFFLMWHPGDSNHRRPSL